MKPGDRVQLTDPDSGVIFLGTVRATIENISDFSLPRLYDHPDRVGVEWDDGQKSTEYLSNENFKLIT